MMALNTRQFNRFYWISSALVFVAMLLRCALVPFAHDEVATFNYYIQPGSFIPFYAHVDAMGHFFSSATAWICFKLFGSSVFSLRLPCLLGFGVLVVAVFKLNTLLTGTIPKLLLTAGFIFSYNFIAFFSLCRGYGISMAFLVFAMYYFFCYARHRYFRHFVKFVFFSQLALSANLTLIFVLLITTFILVVLQFRNRVFLKPLNILLILIHLGVILFWIKYAFFLQDNGALYYGSGDSYWQVTFKTLIETITYKSRIIKVMVLLLFALMAAYFAFRLYKERTSFLFSSNFALSFFTLCSLVVSFFLLKKLFGVNYPEDRAGLFFYVFYVLSLCFMVNDVSGRWRYASLALPLFLVAHFVCHFNLRTHPWRIYETIPVSFYKTLMEEQEKSDRPVTIAGHRLREFIYGFINYNSPVKLNPLTAPEALQMNCDYAIAYDLDKPYYDPYYNELAAENDWGFRLLKRKKPIQRELLVELNDLPPFTGAYEFYNAYEKLDTTFNSINPLQADFEFTVDKAPVPFNAWLVLQIDSKNEAEAREFVRVQLNMLNYDWNGRARFRTSLVTGNITRSVKRLVCYLWNIEQKDISLKINSFRLYRLNGDGVTEISKAKI